MGFASWGPTSTGVPATEVARWKNECKAAKDRAKWIGIATHAANNMPNYPFRDSEASRWRAMAAQRARANKKKGIDGRRRRTQIQPRRVIAKGKGGHDVVQAESGGGWLCTVCKDRSTSYLKLATVRCSGECRKEVKASQHGHTVLRSGTVLWCRVCGSFAESRADRLLKQCVGPPPVQLGSGGLRAQLTKLRAQLHPVTGARLPQAVRLDGSAVEGNGKYARLSATGCTDDHFHPYVPQTFTEPRPRDGATAADKRRLLLGRVRMRQGQEARQKRKALAKIRRKEANELISSFIGVQVTAAGADGNDDSDEEFWSTLDDRDWNTPLSLSVRLTCTVVVLNTAAAMGGLVTEPVGQLDLEVHFPNLAVCGRKVGNGWLMDAQFREVVSNAVLSMWVV